ncbi:MAG: type II secretion system secretin GspD [Nitrospina sp.]|nr:type II secretion system secretin GspD [Nitrospina sp.]MBT3416327.1 type II secretion system secretin GspD [Nitrospina sp.]MBT3856367.1 type II secretion system secretin GspD [Nitrospina sp.]MBT4104766.1 type II secretion system secretin GspD [Nitrospina sp.]MBT4388980.1 type II secretion system secretin GspD [Nitrospina sp.]
MKRIPILLTIFILSATWYGCGATKKSTMHRLKDKTDVVDAMILPDPASVDKKAGADELIDPDKIKNIPESKHQKRIRITNKNTSLHKGPGTQYPKIGTAAKGDLFDLIRVERGYGKGQTWYLAEDAAGGKFFISSQSSTITREKPKPAMKTTSTWPESLTKQETTKQEPDRPEKIELQKRKKASLDRIQTIVKVEPDLPPELKEAKHITLNFEGTELYDVITTFCELLKIDYVIEGNVEGKVTLQTFNKIPVEDLYSVLEQILALNNVAVVKSGNFYRFLQAPDAAKKPMSIHFADDPSIPDKERMIIQIIPLQHISVESMKKIISPLLTTNASFIEIPETNNLMMIEMAYNVRRIIKVVQALDIDKLASSDIQLYKLRNADSEVLVKELEEIFSSMGYKEALGDSLSFLSLTRLNSVLVVNAFDKILPTIEFWVNRLDQPISEGDVSTFVYYVQNGDAAALASLLNGIFQESGGSTGTATKTSTASKKAATTTKANVSGASTTASTTKKPVVQAAGSISSDFDGEVTILPDPDTNSLIIRTSPRNYPAILALINKLDLLPQQVLIEVLIVDLTIDESTATGLELAFKDSSGTLSTAAGISSSTTNASALGSSIGSATASFLAGGSFFIGKPDKIIAQLQLFASDSKTNVLANPILVTSDNKAANISITDEIPIVQESNTPSAGGAIVSATVEYRSVGIKLDITPKINSENFINLQISQEISSRGADVGDQPSFNTRQVNTEVVLKDNQVLVMGGLMRTDTLDTVTGVPVLKDIPYIGRLFGSESTSLKKTELMIFITPHVISSAEDSEFVTSQFKKRLNTLKPRGPKKS